MDKCEARLPTGIYRRSIYLMDKLLSELSSVIESSYMDDLFTLVEENRPLELELRGIEYVNGRCHSLNGKKSSRCYSKATYVIRC